MSSLPSAQPEIGGGGEGNNNTSKRGAPGGNGESVSCDASVRKVPFGWSRANPLGRVGLVPEAASESEGSPFASDSRVSSPCHSHATGSLHMPEADSHQLYLQPQPEKEAEEK